MHKVILNSSTIIKKPFCYYYITKKLVPFLYENKTKRHYIKQYTDDCSKIRKDISNDILGMMESLLQSHNDERTIVILCRC